MLVALLLLACKNDPDDTTPDETPDPWPGWDAVEVDDETLRRQGYTIVRYEIGPEAEDAYTTPIGDNPVFYVVRPSDAEPDEALPTILWFHGGTVGDDHAVPPLACDGARAQELLESGLYDPSNLPRMLHDRRWAMVLPRNDWCDFWQGLGADDPVDPVEHWGYVHVERVMAFVDAAGAGFVPSPWYAWGTSAGGAAAVHVAARHGGFAGIVADSAPTSIWEQYKLTPEALEHLFGGPPYDGSGQPTDAWPRYVACDGEWLVREGGLRVPVAVPWNSPDRSVPTAHPLGFVAALSETYPTDGVPFFAHDFAHEYPDPSHHVQSWYGAPPLGYYTTALMDFLAGAPAFVREAEDACDGVGCDASLPTCGLEEYSNECALTGEPGATGALYEAEAPDFVVGLGEITATAVLVAESLDGVGDAEVVATLAWTDGDTTASIDVTAGDLALTGAPLEDVLHQYRATKLRYTPTTTPGTLTLTVCGRGTLHLDSWIFTQ